MSANSIGKKGRNDRRPNNAGGRAGRPAYLQWGDRNNRNNSPSSPEPSLKPPRRGGMRGNVDKAALNEGVYSNARMMHSATSIVGCVVQVQVRNGRIYEGILKTFSPKMDIVLEKAHTVDESNANGIPSRDRLIETLIFSQPDVVSIAATNVELDFANKDSFTDTAISKFNGQVTEKELQPWDPDSPGDGSLESLVMDAQAPPAELSSPQVGASPTGPRPGQVVHLASSRSGQNGWDANEMFKTNAEQFNVQSSYDPSLSQYTTQLKPDNSKEFREREARAAKLANEIERSESYKQRIELENGDEEELFSAVQRDAPAAGNSSSSSSHGNPKLDLAHVVVQDRYVPPHQRNKKNLGPRPVVNRAKSPVVQSVQSGVSSAQPQAQSGAKDMEPKVNGDKDDKKDGGAGGDKPADTAGPDASKQDTKDHSPPVGGKQDSRLMKQKFMPSMDKKHGREALQKELRDFSSNFKLTDNENKEHEKKGGSHSTSPQPQPQQPAGQQRSLPTTQSVPSPAASPKVPSKTPSPAVDKTSDDKKESSDEKKSESDKLSDTIKNSTLNPKAKEFVLNPMAKPFTPKQQPAQVSTPPRPHTQSPNMSLLHNMQPMYQPLYVPVSMTQQGMQQQQQQQQQHQQARINPKRAVVSVGRPEFNPAAQAAAATGQPLLAQTVPPPQQYMPYVPSGTMQQMVPMPGPRMVGPTGMSQQGHPGQDPQVAQQQAQPYIVSPPGAPTVPHLQHHHAGNPTPPHQAPAHLTGPHQGPQSANPQHTQQASHMVSQSGGHPAQSPVQHQPHHHQPPQQAHHPHHQAHHHQQQQQHHPPPHHAAAVAAAAAAAGQHQHHSGVTTSQQQQQQQQQQQPHPGQPPHPAAQHQGSTAQQQQHILYQQSTQMTQHPPLQPSPHTPTSPQSMHPGQQLTFAPGPAGFSYTSQAAAVQAGGQQLTYAHNHPHTTVTHAHHQQHTHAPQIIMMQHQSQMTPTGGPPAHLQHGPPQPPIMQGPMQGGPHMVPQPTMSVSSHPQIHYMSHHQMNAQHPPQIPAAYQHSQ